MLKVVGLSKSFGGVKAVQNCKFEIERGSIVGLIGPNGAGKTTVFNLITGFLKPDRGNIIYRRKNITNMPPHKIAQLGIGRTFQIIRLFPQLTVLENMLLAIPSNDSLFTSALQFRVVAKEQKENIEKAMELLKFVGLDIKVNALAQNLSYGQQKLLEIARVLALDADLLLLDEPASGVNLTLLKKIAGLIKNMRKSGKTILLIEHNMDFVMKICDKVIAMDHGKEIAYGTPKQIQKNKLVLDAYLGG
ncbi:ABC transporter ATP-binding protein [Candidatus Woesearchaeota archaeon]|nr:MAG: ABC transporter ATP-binding protein [Candidatus Woesearchaeota archaeon]